MLNNRCYKIIDILIESDRPMMIDELSKTFNVSGRTIRYDLDKIDDYLNENGIEVLNRKPNVGISLEDKTKEKLNFNNIDNYEYVLSPKERVNFILCELLEGRGFITINSLAQKIFVSRGTIIKDLPQVKKWVKKYNLRLISYKSHGLKIVGDEKNLRRAVSALFSDNIDTYKVIDDAKDNEKKTDLELSYQVKKLFEDIDIPYIENCISTTEEQLETSFSDNAYNALIVHIAIAIKRMQLNKDIIMDKAELKSLGKTKEFSIASAMAKMLESKFNVNIPADEIGYITIHLLGSNVTYSQDTDRDNWIKLSIITTNIIENMENRTGISLINDRQLFDGLLQHIRPAIYRFKHDLSITNPLLHEIEDTYHDLFKNVKESLKFLEKDLKVNISDEEAAYITLHFGAAVERIKDKDYKKMNVLVVCATGIGTSKLVSSKLQSIFDINIVDTISYHGVSKALKKHKIDLIVTTVPLDIKNIKCVEVSAFLTEKNISELSVILSKLKQTKNESKIDLDDIIKIINNNCDIKNFVKLRRELAKYLNIEDISLESDYKPELIKFINENFVEANIKADTWEEAVRESGNILLKNGYIEESYIHAMINIVKNMGPYIVMAPGVAVAHARPEDGAKKVGVSFAALDKPINFGNDDNDPVKMVVSVCSTDHLSHMKALTQLAEIIEREDFIENISKATNKKELIKKLTVMAEK